MSYRVFYSWQSDLPAHRNRSLIQTAAERALKKLRADGIVDGALDRDTKGTGGTPDIADTIFGKILQCDLFLADVTPVSRRGGLWVGEGVPNPNVMLELGFAICELGWDRIICVVNNAQGRANRLPFHLSQRRHPIEYHCGALGSSRARPTCGSN